MSHPRHGLQTEKVYVYWAKEFVLWVARSGVSFRHPGEVEQAEVEGYRTMLAVEKQVAPATHRQALIALLFLYRQVLGMELPWMQQIGRPPERKRIPVVLTVQEVQSVLSLMTRTEALMAALLYGSGLRLSRHWDCVSRTWTLTGTPSWFEAARVTRTGW